MRADHGKNSSGLLSGALLAIVISLTGVAGAVKIAQSAVNLGPGVGDIISFDTKAKMPGDMNSQVVVARDGSGECMLDLDTLHREGGSLIVEARVPANPPAYRVHWAGNQSSTSQYNCGTSAELTVDGTNLDMLAMAAGGWGPTHQPLIRLSLLDWGSRKDGTD
ncbi:MAG TPA: hypothetical protein VGG99_08030 [Acetobacteraceae bacterium]|jgi:hypothetical protein